MRGRVAPGSTTYVDTFDGRGHTSGSSSGQFLSNWLRLPNEIELMEAIDMLRLPSLEWRLLFWLLRERPTIRLSRLSHLKSKRTPCKSRTFSYSSATIRRICRSKEWDC